MTDILCDNMQYFPHIIVFTFSGKLEIVHCKKTERPRDRVEQRKTTKAELKGPVIPYYEVIRFVLGRLQKDMQRPGLVRVRSSDLSLHLSLTVVSARIRFFSAKINASFARHSTPLQHHFHQEIFGHPHSHMKLIVQRQGYFDITAQINASLASEVYSALAAFSTSAAAVTGYLFADRRPCFPVLVM